MSSKEGWRRPFAVILLCHAGVFLAFSAAFPFVVLYLQELGVTDPQVAAGWAGIINGGTTAVVSLTNPMWGSLSDRWGVKTGLVRCLIMSVIGLVVCSLATAPEHVLIGRLIQGFGGGANAAAIIAVGSIVPTIHLNATMGLMQTAQSLAGALGPALGGIVGDLFSFRLAFAGAAVLLSVVLIAVLLFVHTPPREWSARQQKESMFVGIAFVARAPVLRALVVLFFAFHAAYQLVWTFLPLRMQELVADPDLVGRWSGAAALADALGIALGATIVGWFGGRSRWPPHMLVTGVCVGAAIATLAQVFVERPEVFVALRAVVGLCYGGAVVLMRGALGAEAPAERRGVTYGVGQSAFAAGFSVGALVGSVVAVSVGVLPTFGLSACAFLLVAGWAFATFPRPRATHAEEMATAP